ncbi:MAG: GNAT family N-acetyltransferase [Clostridia bacterium]|nr:GNAT family N-acetyltransferase [Clostridia bacterium]
MKIKLIPVNDDNREAVLALSVRKDQPFVAPNDVSLRQADETNAKHPGVARPFAIYADGTLVGFCMFAFAPELENPADRYWLWRFMIDKDKQDKGYGQAALQEIIRYFKTNGADRLYVSTEPENEHGLHIYHNAGFRETGIISDDEAVLMRMLKGPNKTVKDFYQVPVDSLLHIKGKRGYGVSIAVNGRDEGIETYCSGSGRYGQEFPVNPDMMFQAGSVSKPAFAVTLLRYVDKGIIDLDADISGVVPEFVKNGPVTFSALLSHTAGYNLSGFPGYKADHKPFTLEDILNGKGITPKLRRIRPYGEQYMYSGGGITLAQLAFTRITGVTLREAFQKEVAEPLGLKRTGYFQPLDEQFVPFAAFGNKLAYRENKNHGYHYFPEHAAAGLWSTPTELSKLGIAISRSYREGGLLKQETARRMLTPVKDEYGLCIQRLSSDVAYHDGWNVGFITDWMISLRDDLCVVSMINNTTNKPLCQANLKVALELFQNIEEEIYEDTDKSCWESYCGKYEQNCADFLLDEVFLKDGKLYAKIAGKKNGENIYQLYPTGDKTFGRKGGFAKIEFGDNCLTVDGIACKKL